MNHLLREVLPALDLPESYAAQHLALAGASALPSALPVSTLACGSVAAAGLAASALVGGQRVRVDPRQVAVSFRADQLLSLDGASLPGFAPLSGFFEASDGWVRTHANYPHHRDRLLRALGLLGRCHACGRRRCYRHCRSSGGRGPRDGRPRHRGAGPFVGGVARG